MKILYIYRHPDLGFSIGKVFKPIAEEMKKYAEVDSIYLPVPNYSLKGLWKNIRYAQKYCKRKEYDIIHITGTEHYLRPFLLGKKVIVTVHDLGHFLHLKGIRRWKYWLMQVAVLKFADAITCISSKTLHELQPHISIPRERVSIIPNAVDDNYTFCPKEFHTDCPTILHIGTRKSKNLRNSILALKDFKCKLRIVGKLEKTDIDLLQTHNIDYSIVHDLSDAEILQEYQKADIINFPSLYEGFGMPIIEGQAIGRLVITSDIEPMKSVAGNGAILCNPYDIHSIRSAYTKGVNDEYYRDCMIKKGIENAKHFALSDIALKYFTIYKKLFTK